MTLAHIIYHQEDDGWWAECPEFPSFFAAGDTFDDTKAQVRDGLPHVAGDRKYLRLIHLVVHAGSDKAVGAEGIQEVQTGLDPQVHLVPS
jgi:hypothetical protein